MVRQLSLSEACEGFIHYKRATGRSHHTIPFLDENAVYVDRRAGRIQYYTDFGYHGPFPYHDQAEREPSACVIAWPAA
jgi:hypothetical protein